MKDSSECEEFFSDKEVMKFIGDGGFDFNKTSSLEMVTWFMKSCDEESGLGTWAIHSLESHKVVGNCHLSKCSELNEVEFGLALSKEYWGKGYGTEISKGLLEYGHVHLGIKKIIGTVHHNNFGSKVILQRLGYKLFQNILLYGIEHELYLKSESKRLTL